MKCQCLKTCQYRGVTNEGDMLEMTEAEMKKPFVARHFVVVGGGIAADGAAAGKTPPSVEVGGKVLPMTKRQIAQKLASFGVKVKPGATTEELYAALKEAQAPNLELA